VIEPTNMSSAVRFMISKAPLVPTKHDAAGTGDCTNIVVGLFRKLAQQIVGDSNVVYVLAEKPKSDIYRDMLPLLNSGRVELLDVPRLAAQLCGLERRSARGGRDSVDHAPSGHDDLCNSAAGVLVQVAGGPQPIKWDMAMVRQIQFQGKLRLAQLGRARGGF
jgi:hypothetical protein